VEFFFDPIDDSDRRQQTLAYQAFYSAVTWACADCGSERTLELNPDTVRQLRDALPKNLRHTVSDEKVPSGLHYKVRCVDCNKTTNGMPPSRYRMGRNGSAELLETRLVQPGHCVIGWGIVDEIGPSTTNPDKLTVTVEGGFTWDEDADDHVMIMSPVFDQWMAHAIPGSKWIEHDGPTAEETAAAAAMTAEAMAAMPSTRELGYAELHDRMELVIAERGDNIVVWTDGAHHPPYFTAEGEPFTLLGHVLIGLGVGPELIADLIQLESAHPRDVFAAADFAFTAAADDLADIVWRRDNREAVPGDPGFRWSECIRLAEPQVRSARVPQDAVSLAETERAQRPDGPPALGQ
jgi:hypothetical protein